MWSNTDLQATDTTVEMDYASGGPVTRDRKYITEIRVALHSSQYSPLYESENINESAKMRP